MKDLIQRIEAAIAPARARLLETELLRAMASGTIPRAVYQEWLVQQYHFTRHTPRFLAAAASRFGYAHEAVRHRFLKHCLEEFGHEQMCMRGLVALGVDPEDVERATPYPATTALVAFHYYLAERVNPFALLGTIYTFEGLAESEAPRVVAGLERAGLPRKALEFIDSHGRIDIAHMAEARRLLTDHVHDPEDERAIIYACQGGFDLYRYVFDEVWTRAGKPTPRKRARTLSRRPRTARV